MTHDIYMYIAVMSAVTLAIRILPDRKSVV